LLRTFQQYVEHYLHTSKSGRFLTFTSRESNFEGLGFMVFNTQMGHASPFQTYKFQELFNDIFLKKSNEFWPLQSPFKDLGLHQDSNSQNGSSLGSVGVHSFTLFYILESMKCDSRASLLIHTFASLCLNREPKAKVVTFDLTYTF